MQDKEKYNDNLNNICEETRFAISVSDELTDKQEKHLCECAECRTFKEQSEKLSEHLKSFGVAFDNKELGVADSVMKEINAQRIFTAGSPLKTRRIFRHAGLVAACLIVTVMALPFINATFMGANSADSAAENQSTEQDISLDAQEYKYKMTSLADGVAPESEKATNGALLDAYDYADEEAVNDGADGNVSLRTTADDMQGYAGNTDAILFANSELSDEIEYQAEIVSESLTLTDEIYQAALGFAQENALDTSNAFTNYISSQEVYVDFMDAQSNVIFRIYLECSDGIWNITATERFGNQAK